MGIGVLFLSTDSAMVQKLEQEKENRVRGENEGEVATA